MQRLLEERACHTFLNHVIALTNWVENYANRLGDESIDFTTDALMRLHFDKVKQDIETVLSDPSLVDAFQRFYPAHAHMIDAGRDLCASFDRLHTVRKDMIAHHRDGNKNDVKNFKDDLTLDPHMTNGDKDLAKLHGMTEAQLTAWKSQVDVHGFVHLSRSERKKLRDAILKELN